MSTITAILEAQADGTVHLPVPAEMRHGRIEVTATLRPANGLAVRSLQATPEMLRRRSAAIQGLRSEGGLRNAIPDPAEWQREIRQDRPLPGRE